MKKISLPVLKKALRLVRQHGWSLLLERFVRRKEILSTPPVVCDPESALEVHTQVCRRDWLNGIWTLKSLRVQCGSAFNLFVYLDANVPPEVREILERHFPGARIPGPDWLEEQVRRKLTPIAPAMAALWRARHSPTLCKLVNAWLCARNECVLYLDPDVLFFAPPRELLEFIRNGRGGSLGLFNVTGSIPESVADTGAYSLFEADVLETYRLKLPRDFNCGLEAVRLGMLDWPFLEEVLNTLRWRPDRTLMVEQTCFAVQAMQSGWERLDRNRYLVGGDGTPDETVVTIHYTGARRDLFYVEGVPRLRRQGFMQKLADLPPLATTAPAAGVMALQGLLPPAGR